MHVYHFPLLGKENYTKSAGRKKEHFLKSEDLKAFGRRSAGELEKSQCPDAGVQTHTLI